MSKAKLSAHEDPAYLSQQIITYIGNKRALLPFIESGIVSIKKILKQEKISFLDLFSGTGIVARMARSHACHIYCNDLERYSFVTNQCYQTNQQTLDQNALEEALHYIKGEIKHHFYPGFIAELYAPQNDADIQPGERVFYTRYNAIFLDSLCRILPKIDSKLRCYILAPVLAQASKYVNTSGVFKGFYKNRFGIGQYGGDSQNALSRIKKKIDILKPVFSLNHCCSEIFQMEANQLVGQLVPVDIAYFDPPYNQHPYGSNYFMLNLLCDYQRPFELSEVGGIPRDWNRSPYNKASMAKTALFNAVEDVRAKFVLISYNSEGFIPKEEFISELSALGHLKVMDKRYNTFRGCRNLNQRDIYVTEHLFLLDKR